MTQKRKNPAWQGGAPESHAGRLDVSDNSGNRRAMQCSAEIDELLWKLGNALRAGRLTAWERSFALSVLGQAKRPCWSPSGKQLATLRSVIAGLVEPDTRPLIDDGGGDDCAA